MIHIIEILLICTVMLFAVRAASKDKPHVHQGVLTAYSGHHLPYDINAEQLKKLHDGKPVNIIAFCLIYLVNRVKFHL